MTAALAGDLGLLRLGGLRLPARGARHAAGRDQDRSALAGPAIRAAERAPGAELIRLPGGHYAPFLDAHEQAVAAELSFLRRHVLAGSSASSVWARS
jgi:uncharacterized protein